MPQEAAQTAELVVSELVTNAVRFSGNPARHSRYSERVTAELAVIENDIEREAKTSWVLQQIQDEVDELREHMSDRNWPRTILVGVGGIIASALTVGTTIATGGAALALGLGIGGGVASIPPAVYQAADLVRSRRFDPRAPLAYAALAHKRFSHRR